MSVLLDEPRSRAGLAITAGDLEDLVRCAGLAVVAHADPAEILMRAGGRRLRRGVEGRQGALATAGRQQCKR